MDRTAGSVSGAESSAAWSVALRDRIVGGHRALAGSQGVAPRDGPSLAGLSQRDPDPDPRQPRTEWPLPSPARELPIRGHHGLLRGILGVGPIPEDPMARPNERDRFALDQAAEGLAVAGQDGVDDGAFVREGRGPIERLGFDADVSPFRCRPAGGWGRRDGRPP